MSYKIHPVAAIFPIMTGRPFSDLLNDIHENGQLDPIVVDGDMLLDGRNRLAACEKLGIKPKVVQWRDIAPAGVEVFYWIFSRNMERRHLTDDQRAAIGAEFFKYQDSVGKQQATQFKAGQSGNPSGKARQVTPESEQPAKRDKMKDNANSTAGRLAEAVGTSRYKAAVGIALKQLAEKDPKAAEQLNNVIAGQLKLCDTVAAPKPKSKWETAKSVKKVRAIWDKCPKGERDNFADQIKMIIK